MGISLREEMLQEIKQQILYGFDDKADIIENIKDMLYEEDKAEISEAWITQQVEEWYTKRLKEEQTWPAVTDFDRLGKAFDELNGERIICLHMGGATKQDGLAEAEGIYDDLEQQGIEADGYCFYHSQDVDGAIASRILLLSFGSFSGSPQQGMEIGQRIVQKLKQHNLSVEWDGKFENRIAIVDFTWQKRHDNEDWGYDRNIKFIVGTKEDR